MVQIVNTILGGLTLITGLTVVAGIFIVGFSRTKSGQSITPLINLVQRYGLVLIFVIALVATLGSLFYSDVAGYEPCKLCWLQRIFMYPQVVILLIALIIKDKQAVVYSWWLSVIGGLIALYHYLLQIGVVTGAGCAVVGYSTSCSQRFVFQFGYITIPMMALTAFAAIILIGSIILFIKPKNIWSAVK